MGKKQNEKQKKKRLSKRNFWKNGQEFSKANKLSKAIKVLKGKRKWNGEEGEMGSVKIMQKRYQEEYETEIWTRKKYWNLKRMEEKNLRRNEKGMNDKIQMEQEIKCTWRKLIEDEMERQS